MGWRTWPLLMRIMLRSPDVRNAILDFQAASAALGQADDATGEVVTEALIALYGGPYSEDAEPSSLGYDCINQSIERLSFTPFQPF